MIDFCTYYLILMFKIPAIKFGFPWHVPGSYPTIRGTMYLNDVTFANFGNQCGDKSVAIRTNPAYEDMQMPIIAFRIPNLSFQALRMVPKST